MTIFSHITFLDKLLFTKHLAIMLKSGIPLTEALEIFAGQSKRSQGFDTVTKDILSEIRNGNTFAKALHRHPKIFDAFYISLVEVGENSGTLDETLLYLSDHLGKEYAFRKKVKGALMYPIIVLSAALLVGISISLFVLPKLIDLFKGFDVKLPLTTQLMLSFAVIMRDYGIILVIGLVLLIVLFKYLCTTALIKPNWHAFLLKIPIFGGILRDSELTNMCRSLGVMIKSGLPITQSLEIEKQVVTNLVFKKYVINLSHAIASGKSLSSELATGKYVLIPEIAEKMIAVGEKTGKIDETLLYLGSFFEDEVDDATKNLSTTLEPFMLLVIGLIVAFIAMAIISPIYELTGSIKR